MTLTTLSFPKCDTFLPKFCGCEPHFSGGAEEGEVEADDGGDDGGMDLEDLIERKDVSADLDKACSLLVYLLLRRKILDTDMFT